MSNLPLQDRTILITGAARRIGRSLARACAQAGGNVVIHFHHSEQDAAEVQREIVDIGRKAWLVQADLADTTALEGLIDRATQHGPLYGLVNNAAIFEPLSLEHTTWEAWNAHMAVNLQAPFWLSRGFAAQIPVDGEGRIVNMLDWRALRPGADHFPYTISKAALGSMTYALAAALAPRIAVNGLALGAILPPEGQPPAYDLLKSIPAGRWGELGEVESAVIFLLSGPPYITGQIIHVDGGRHLI